MLTSFFSVSFNLILIFIRFTMTTTFLPRRTRWLEVGAVLALFLVIQVLANDTGKFISQSFSYITKYFKKKKYHFESSNLNRMGISLYSYFVHSESILSWNCFFFCEIIQKISIKITISSNSCHQIIHCRFFSRIIIWKSYRKKRMMFDWNLKIDAKDK